MCQLEFYSNKNKKYGPYGSASSSRGYYEGKRLSMIFLSIFFKVFNAFFKIFVYILWIVNNVPRDWSGAIKMDRFLVGFAGASVDVDAIRNDHEILWLISLCMGNKRSPNPKNI